MFGLEYLLAFVRVALKKKMKEKTYYGIFSRYIFRLSPVIVNWTSDNKWKDNIGSYKLVDKGSCYDSFEITSEGQEKPISMDRPFADFTKAELCKEIKEGYLVTPFKMRLIKIIRFFKLIV